MKHGMRIGSAAVLALAFALSGCNDGLTDLNDNPNEPVQVTADYLFANATEAAASRVHGSTLNMDVTALWVQHYAESRYSAEDRYEITDGAINTHWTNFYAGPLQDLQEVIQKGVEADRPNVEAVGTIMRSWVMHVVTDLWGDAGYSEALQGRTSSGLVVAYDPQQAIYDDLFVELAGAAAMIDPTGVKITTGDMIYQGNMDRWRRFANSLRLRAAMRLSQVDQTKARTEFADALTDGVFTSNADNALLRYVDNGVDVHPIFGYERSRIDHAISKTMVDTLASFADPRLPLYAYPNNTGLYVGMQNGSNADPPLSTISRIGPAFASANSPAVLMSYAEVLFLQAEAAARGWITGDAGTLYAQAITAAMTQLGVSAGAITNYLAQPRVQYQGGEAGLRQIWLQKWIALFGNGPEAFAEWRRTGTPALLPGPDAINDGLIPVRLTYPGSEQTLNKEAMDAAISRQGGANSLNNPVWWDVGSDAF